MPTQNHHQHLSPEDLEKHFAAYRQQIIGIDQAFATPYGDRKILYADWAASGRLYTPIEHKLSEWLGPFAANPHTESNLTGSIMTQAYEEAKRIIKRHVHAAEDDVVLFPGAGMTGAVNKLQRLLGLKVPTWISRTLKLPEEDRPIVFVTHMEHHSNQLSWAETIADVALLEPGGDGLVDPEQLEQLLRQHRHRRCKIGAFTAGSNVTGLRTPYRALARKMHEHGGLCFVDFAASAPYDPIDMHPEGAPLEDLDGIFFSPHKFLGGPGGAGVLVVNSRLCPGPVPDSPGGGTVLWTDLWGGRDYVPRAEVREDGGTPGVLQAAKAALAVQLKESMGLSQIRQREQQLTTQLLEGLMNIPQVYVLEGEKQDRLGVVSILFRDIHYNLAVELLNDHYGIQARGGCSCAGPYGHYLLGLTPVESQRIRKAVIAGDLSAKPGWVRFSLHPSMTSAEIHSLIRAVQAIALEGHEWMTDYTYNPAANEWRHVRFSSAADQEYRSLTPGLPGLFQL